MSYETISAQELFELHQQGNEIDLIDVRMPAEYREVHVPFAKNSPLDQLKPDQLMATRTDEDSPLFVICHKGGRSKMACDQLAAAGFADRIINVEGGTLAWETCGQPVERGKKTISLERQVRIVAGFLALLGAVLAWLVHPYFIALSGFIGAGLLFAGLTDTCGMGMILARMPWNQASGEGSSCKTR